MRLIVILILGTGAITACQTTTDPSRGGFLNGVNAISSGTYKQRSDTLDGEIVAERQRQAALLSELNQLDTEYSALQRQIRDQQERLKASQQPVPARLERAAEASLAPPQLTGNTTADIERLRRSVASARQVVNDLADLGA